LADTDDLRIARLALKGAHRDAFARLAQILFEEDPIGINFQDNTDEYEPEAGTILPHLRKCQTVADVQALLYTEFVRWFGVDTAGPPERYRRAAERLWAEMPPVSLP
jgi:hypothetical protein